MTAMDRAIPFVGDADGTAAETGSSLARWRVVASYLWRHRRYPDLDAPTRFTELVQRRKLTDRSPRQSQFLDKLGVKAMVSARLGTEWIIPTLWHGQALPASPQFDVPAILKARHGCNQYAVLCDVPSAREWRRLQRTAARWQRRPYGIWLDEWAYRGVPRGLIASPCWAARSRCPWTIRSMCSAGRRHMCRSISIAAAATAGSCTTVAGDSWWHVPTGHRHRHRLPRCSRQPKHWPAMRRFCVSTSTRSTESPDSGNFACTPDRGSIRSLPTGSISSSGDCGCVPCRIGPASGRPDFAAGQRAPSGSRAAPLRTSARRCGADSRSLRGSVRRATTG